eukprot:CAMPEP_0204871928 /NCGR_PEP_ID=MMETSP1348-20121228/36844_1 /ASSEMBLY_ACC=CAM_ASM_000700 /TAXON_ID=215587 /ORGANISM="Aplanochytrium stocchinoi, Strain GSBS06" /LENGTH=505 /DNA_ID=CAMNT_0052026499 /DNA_START=52 /DNA_END=1570 /DNA_ORIENTATION=+
MGFMDIPESMGRPAAALTGAALTTTLVYIAGCRDIPSGIHMDTLALLLGLMIIAQYVEMAGLVSMVTNYLKRYSGAGLIIRIILISGILAPFLMNDTVCIFLTRSVSKATHFPGKDTQKIEILALISLASAANIGSALTTIGNPQNSLVQEFGKESGVTAGSFFVMSILPTFLALGVTIVYLVLLLKWSKAKPSTYIPSAAVKDNNENPKMSHVDATVDVLEISLQDHSSNVKTQEDAALKVDINESEISPKDTSREDSTVTESKDEDRKREQKEKLCLRTLKIGIILILSCMIVSLMLLNSSPGWTAIVGAVALLNYEAVAVIYVTKSYCYQDILSKRFTNDIDWPLLILFIGQFILVARLTDTGYPQYILDTMLGSFPTVEHGAGLAVLMIIVVIGSNIISNVPLIVLIHNSMTLSFTSWVAVAWFSTIAGNLTIIGSAANLIVASQYQGFLLDKQELSQDGDDYRQSGFTTLAHAKINAPVTILNCCLGYLYFNYLAQYFVI